MAAEIASLSDEDLREQLLGYGVNVGPITCELIKQFQDEISARFVYKLRCIVAKTLVKPLRSAVVFSVQYSG